MSSPIDKIQNELDSQEADAILITKSINIGYLTGFFGLSAAEREGALIIEHDKVTLIIPRLYEPTAKTLPSYQNKNLKLKISEERNNILNSTLDSLDSKHKILYESHDLRANELTSLQSIYDKTEFINCGQFIENLRQIKTGLEIQKIKKAVEITDKTYISLVQWLKHTDYRKLTEVDVADRISIISRELKGEGLGFDSIVACGTGSAEPHYEPKIKKLKKNNLLLLDFGIKYQGYSGDLTRCVYLGKAPEKIRKIHSLVLNNNLNCINHCKPGVSAHNLYSVSVESFRRHDLEDKFLHGLGHGIGLEIHEEPKLRKNNEAILKKGMTLTIEPGLYFEKQFGIRIEDYVVLTDKNCKILSTSPHALIEIYRSDTMK